MTIWYSRNHTVVDIHEPDDEAPSTAYGGEYRDGRQTRQDCAGAFRGITAGPEGDPTPQGRVCPCADA